MNQNWQACAWKWPSIFAVVVVALPMPGPVAAQTLWWGEVQQLPVITISMRVGSTERETRQVTYTPPPGWYVRSHRVYCTRKEGNSSFTVTSVPQNFYWVTDEEVGESYRTLIDMAGKAGNPGLQARYILEREEVLLELHKVRSTHHALVVNATAKGEGFMRGCGSLELTVRADLVFIGTAETWNQAVAEQQASQGR